MRESPRVMTAHHAIIALGSNLGHRESMLDQALATLLQAEGVVSVRCSTYHETSPVGGPPDQPMYLNAAAQITTSRSAASLLDLLLATEAALGRVRHEPNGPRTLDLDLLLYDDEIIDTLALTVPHPRMHERAFVLAPLVEIAPDLQHPLRRQTIRELYEALLSS